MWEGHSQIFCIWPFRIVNISNTVPEVFFSEKAIKYNKGTFSLFIRILNILLLILSRIRNETESWVVGEMVMWSQMSFSQDLNEKHTKVWSYEEKSCASRKVLWVAGGWTAPGGRSSNNRAANTALDKDTFASPHYFIAIFSIEIGYLTCILS